MADRPTITTLSAGAKYDTSTLNANFQALRDAFDSLLGTDGTDGDNNTMSGDLDLNGNVLRNATFDGSIVGLEWQGDWVTATAYAVNDLVKQSGSVYICIVAHTSGTFATDLSALKWELFASKGDAGEGTGDLLASNNLDDVDNADTARDNLKAMGTDSNEIYAASSAGNDTYAITLAPAATAYTTGMLLTFKADVANTGAATINVNSLGAKNLKKFDSTGKVDVETGDILANQFCRLVYDGTDMILLNPTPAAGGAGFNGIEVFTSSGTWTKPNGLTRVRVTVVGSGGGGGGGWSGAPAGGGGGGGGGAAIKVIEAASLGATETVTVGAAGAAGAAGSGGTGGSGNTSSFGSHASATGGGGGPAGNQDTVAAGGIGSSGDINIAGGGGARRGSTPGGTGGSSIMSGGGKGGSSGAAGSAGTHGSGGGGGASDADRAGGAGGAGIVIVEEYV